MNETLRASKLNPTIVSGLLQMLNAVTIDRIRIAVTIDYIFLFIQVLTFAQEMISAVIGFYSSSPVLFDGLFDDEQ